MPPLIRDRSSVWVDWLSKVEELAGRGRFLEAVTEATGAIDRIKSELRECGLEFEDQANEQEGQSWTFACLPGHLSFLYLVCSYCHLCTGTYASCIDDATTTIHHVRLFKNNPDHYANFIDVEHDALYSRAQAYLKTGKFDKASKDFRAVCSMKRLHGENISERTKEYTMEKAVTDALMCMAMQKVQDNVARPHFTSDERVKIQRELGIGPFSVDKYNCLSCHKRPSSAVKLSLCSGCRTVQYCSMECAKLGWKEHKKECKKMMTVSGIPESHRSNLEGQLASQGYAVLFHHTGPSILLKDPRTGELFESLTDQVSGFIPDNWLSKIL